MRQKSLHRMPRVADSKTRRGGGKERRKGERKGGEEERRGKERGTGTQLRLRGQASQIREHGPQQPDSEGSII